MAKKIDYASLFTKRSDGRYQAVIPDENGGRSHYLYDHDPEVLYSKVEEFKKPKIKTLREVAEEWKESHWKNINIGTQYAYKAPYDLMIAEHGDYAITDVTAAEINRIMLREKELNKSYKHASTVRTMYKLTFNYAIVHGYIDTNPALAVNIPRGLLRSRREAPENDVIQIIKDNLDQPFGLFPYFLIHTGFRTGEAIGVRWSDIDYKNNTVRCQRSVELHTTKPQIKEPKTKAGYRTVPLLNELKDKLIRPDNAKDEDYVFADKNGNLLSRSALRSRWLTWCRSTGLAEKKIVTRTHSKKKIEYKATEWHPTLTAHQLRHGYATILYEAGIDEITAMELMGHADIETTHSIYTHLRQNKREGIAAILNKEFESINVKPCVKTSE